jgi:hypothetical protein
MPAWSALRGGSAPLRFSLVVSNYRHGPAHAIAVFSTPTDLDAIACDIARLPNAPRQKNSDAPRAAVGAPGHVTELRSQSNTVFITSDGPLQKLMGLPNFPAHSPKDHGKNLRKFFVRHRSTGATCNRVFTLLAK